MNWRIPLADIDFGPEESAAVLAVLESKWLTMGGVTQQFEQEFAAFTGAKYALSVSNATAALHMACLALGLGPGDEVIVPSLTFVATANAVRYVGATPVFADVNGYTDFNISPAEIQKHITPKTRAILVVHYAGYPCDMLRIMQIAAEHGLEVIEDNAHGVGAMLAGRPLGTWGAIGCFSFFSNKNMTTGEGGMLTTNREDLYEKLRIFRSHGMTTLTWDRHKGHAFSYDVVELGYNYRIDEIRAALGREQLKKLPRNNARRAELTQLYRETMQKLTPEVTIPFASHAGQSSYHILPALLPAHIERTQVMEHLKAQGIQTSIHYPPTHRFTAYRSLVNGAALPFTEEIARREITLPLYPMMKKEDVMSVVQEIQTILSTTPMPP
ncbi:MAG: DegT/DnrJ/EryC1/StrS aminotransferase [Anaerolineae bacterium]|nr:MAG: DegT/DnrJ/EryC1/StrS aminotransferase [Anaerolineae bacterium]